MAMMALMALSCSREAVNSSTEQRLAFEPYTFRAGWDDGALLRTEIQSDGTTVMWSGEERIHLFFVQNSSYPTAYRLVYDDIFVSAQSGVRETAFFDGMLPIGIYNPYPHLDKMRTYDWIWAVYPCDGLESYESNSVYIRNHNQQQGFAGSFANQSFPAVAKVDVPYGQTGLENELVLQNVCGGARFRVSQEGITSVTFRSAKGEPLAGKARIVMDASGHPAIKSFTDGIDQVTVVAPEGGFIPGENYYAVFFPQTLPEGLSVTFNKGTRSATKTVNKAITINRSRFGILDNLDSGLPFDGESPGPNPDPNGIIAFEDANAKAACVAAFDKNNDGELSYGEAASVTSIEGVFSGQDAMVAFDEFRFFSGVREIPEKGFSQCYRLKRISLPDGLTTIGPSAFNQCLMLETIQLGTGLKRIEKNAFYGADQLKNIHLPNLSVWMNLDFEYNFNESYGQPFYGSKEGHLYLDGKELTEIDIPEGVTKVRMFCFYNCKNLTKVSFPHGLTATDWNAFLNCVNLKTACYPSMEDLFAIEYERVDRGRHPFGDSGEGRRLLIGGEEVTRLVFPEGTKTIPDYAFFNCDRITDVTIPKSVERIGRLAGPFVGCTQLKRLNVPGLKEWCAVQICGYILSGDDCHLFAGGQEITSSLVIPEGVTGIGAYCFSNLRGIEEVRLPEGFKSVGSSAFYRCDNLTRVHIPDISFWVSTAYSLASAFFGSSHEGHLFIDGQEVKQVQIPEGLTSTIVEKAFIYCKGLESITVPGGVTSIRPNAFSDCTHLKNVVIGKDVASMAENVFVNDSKLESITLLPLMPPSINSVTFAGTSCPIYVDGEFLSVYKEKWTAQLHGWDPVIGRLTALPQ